MEGSSPRQRLRHATKDESSPRGSDSTKDDGYASDDSTRSWPRRSLDESLDVINDVALRAGLTYHFLSMSYLTRLGGSVLFFVGFAFINTLASVVAGHRTPYIAVLDLDGAVTGKHTLPDLGHDLWGFVLKQLGYSVDYVPSYGLPDSMVSFLTVVTLIFVAVHPKRLQILRRSIVILGIMMWLRALCVSFTQLPDASPVCYEQFTDPVKGAYKREAVFPRAFFRAWKFFWDPTNHVTCGDMIFSGHTTFLMLFAMTFKQYCRADYMETRCFIRATLTPEWLCKLARWSVYVYVAIGAVLIIGTRLHYTLDTAIALYATYWTFVHYHSWLPPTQASNRVFRWFEAEEVLSLEHWAYERARKVKAW